MGLGASIVIFAIGAILAFGVTVRPTGLDLDAVGVILMIVGIVGGLVSALFLMSWSPWPYRTVVRDRYVSHTHEPADHNHTTREPG
ncbi:MAG: hypothetical protein WD646_04880 [Actinomycetota bacterium]